MCYWLDLLSYPLLYSTLLYTTLLYATLPYSTLLYSTLLYSTLLYTTLLYATLLYSTLFSLSYPPYYPLLSEILGASCQNDVWCEEKNEYSTCQGYVCTCKPGRMASEDDKCVNSFDIIIYIVILWYIQYCFILAEHVR